VLRAWLLPLMVICSACSDRVMLSGIHRDRSDASVMVAAPDSEPAAATAPTEWTLFLDSSQTDDALTGTLVPEDDTILGPSGERPRLVLRCEAGQVGAYVVMEGSEEAEPDPAGADYVPVELDSAQSC
jgi:hypothetical protein